MNVTIDIRTLKIANRRNQTSMYRGLIQLPPPNMSISKTHGLKWLGACGGTFQPCKCLPSNDAEDDAEPFFPRVPFVPVPSTLGFRQWTSGRQVVCTSCSCPAAVPAFHQYFPPIKDKTMRRGESSKREPFFLQIPWSMMVDR